MHRQSPYLDTTVKKNKINKKTSLEIRVILADCELIEQLFAQ